MPDPSPIIASSTIPTNPSALQTPSDPAHVSALPLYLIHDGGGTIYAYHGFQKILRPVWGISNPRFSTGRRFRGGITEMASIYAELIRESRPTRGIILGGWSLGGSLAVEIARILHVDGTVPIAGVVLIDTPCPNPAVKALLPKLRFDEHCPPETRLLVEMSVRESLRMAGSYDPPLFEGDWRRPETEPAEMAQPPPFVLLRATEYMPIEISPDPKRGMDCTRELPLLGWEHTGLGAGSWGTRVGEGQRVELVKAVLEVQGHHCNLFEDHPEELTMQMNKACEMLERNYKRNESSGGDSEWERLVPPEYRTTNYQRKFKAKL